jgi:hypothetical protein
LAAFVCFIGHAFISGTGGRRAFRTPPNRATAGFPFRLLLHDRPRAQRPDHLFFHAA